MGVPELAWVFQGLCRVSAPGDVRPKTTRGAGDDYDSVRKRHRMPTHLYAGTPQPQRFGTSATDYNIG